MFFKSWLFFVIITIPILASPLSEVDQFISSLSTKDRRELESFLSILMTEFRGNTNIGYSLWGDKPISTRACIIANETRAFGFGESVKKELVGMELWQRLGCSPSNKEHFFLIFNTEEYRNLVCINRQAFLRAVQENLSLFRYVLQRPTLTPEGLLEELIKNKERFYDIIKGDRVLYGILLGFGTENALLGTMKEIFGYDNVKEREEDFPLIPRQVRENHDAEVREIDQLMVLSTDLKPFTSYEIPRFGCKPESEETKKLLATYEKNREKIKQVLEGEHFLRETLLQLFTTTSGNVEIPKFASRQEEPIKTDLCKLISLICKELKSEQFFHKDFLRTFLDGVRASEGGKSVERTKMQKHFEIQRMGRALERWDALHKAESHFAALARTKNITEVVPNKVYYKTQQTGTGAHFSKKSGKISLYYSCQALGEHTFGTIKDESLDRLIPGVALGIMNMQKGEVREIHIHPAYGYGENSFFPPNVVIIAKIELIDFTEIDQESKIVSPYRYETCDFEQLLTQYRNLMKEVLFARGNEFWDFMKNSNHKIDFRAFEKSFNQDIDA